jgi:hypothetical protein
LKRIAMRKTTRFSTIPTGPFAPAHWMPTLVACSASIPFSCDT